MLSNPYLQYRRTQAETADPGELVVLLYEGAIRFLQRATLAIKAGDAQAAHDALVRSQDIINELNVSLDHSRGGIADNLARLYEYMYWRLVQANCQKDLAAIEDVIGLLRELLPAWQEAVRANRRRQAEPARPVSFSQVPVRAG